VNRSLDPPTEPQTDADVPNTSFGSMYFRLLGFLKHHKAICFLSVLAVLLDAVGQAFFVYLLRPLIDETLMSDSPDISLMLPALVLVAVVVRVIGNFGGIYGMEWMGRRLIANLRRDLFGHYLVVPVSEFDREGSGQQISRLTYNTEQVAQAATTALIGVVRDTAIVLALLGVMLIQSWRLTLTMLLLLPVVAFVVLVVSRRFRAISHRIQDSMGEVTQRTEQIVQGQEVVRVYAGHASESRAFEGVNESNRRLHLRLRATQLLSSSLIQLVAGIAVVVLLVIASSQFLRAEVSPGVFMSVLAAMVASIPPLKRLTNIHLLIQKGMAAAESIYASLDRPAEVDTGQHAPSSITGRVEFQDVSFEYPGRDERVLDEIKLTLDPGTVTALVGRSGSGKTTLARLLPRFYRPTGGTILLDGVKLNEYALTYLRRQVALVSQETVLFNDTVRANIAYGGLAASSNEAIEQAARDANAWEFIEALPDGMDTVLGQQVSQNYQVQLSGGQKQRIAIARALLKDAPLLILDEATSALDSESERAVQQGLSRLMKNRTTLVIAHRLTTIEQADQVIVLDQGRIIQRGRHAELLAEPNGLYQLLYRAQFQNVESSPA